MATFLAAFCLFHARDVSSTLTEFDDGYDPVFFWQPKPMPESNAVKDVVEINIIPPVESSASTNKQKKDKNKVIKISKGKNNQRQQEMNERTKRIKLESPKSRPTLQPTKNPTMKPTEMPTSEPLKDREQWDCDKSFSGKNKQKKKNDDTSKDDEKYLKAYQKSKSQKKKDKPIASNRIELYSYDLPADMTNDERGTIIEVFQQELLSNDKFNFVIIKDFSMSATMNKSAANYVNLADEALDRLAYIVLNILASESGYTTHEFNENFGLFIHVLASLDESWFSEIMKALSISQGKQMTDVQFTFFVNVRTQFHQMKGSQWALRVIEYELSEEMLGVIVHFLYIAFNELLVQKLKETESLIYSSSYALAGKIPVKYKKEFLRLREKHIRYVKEDLPQMLKKSSIAAFEMLGDYFGDLSLFAADLNIARIIFEWRQGNKGNHGLIGISAGDLANTKDIDELLNVLGYDNECIYRFKVLNAQKQGKIKTVAWVLSEKITRISASEKPKRKQKKKPVAVKDSEIRTDGVELLDMKDLESAINNKKYEMLIFMDRNPKANASLLPNRINLFNQYDVAFDLMWRSLDAMMEYLNRTQEQPLPVAVTTLFTIIIFGISELDQHVYDHLMTALRSDIKKVKRLVVIIDIAHAHYKKIGYYEPLQWIEKEHGDPQLLHEMLVFVRIVLLQSSDTLLKNIGEIFDESRYGQSDKLPVRLHNCWIRLIMEASEFYSKEVATGISMDTLKGSSDNLRKGSTLIRTKVMQIKLAVSIGQIIYERQRSEQHGFIGIAIDMPLNIAGVLYDVLKHLGYDNKTITTQNSDIEEQLELAKYVEYKATS